jgi:diguanylate cyclase (GGDEF)-like protein
VIEPRQDGGLVHASGVNLPARLRPPHGRFGARLARVAGSWILLSACVAVLVGRDVLEYALGGGSLVDVAISVVIAAALGWAVLTARSAGVQVERRHSEAESFSRILRALSRSVSSDAVVEAIVHELGTATDADHVAVVRVRPGGTVLDVTFVSMLPGAPTSNTVMSIRQLEPVEARRLRELPHHPDGPRHSWRESSGHGQDVARGAAAHGGIRARTLAVGGLGGDDQAQEIADRIAFQLGDAYGLRHTLAAPLESEQGIAGAIVLSRRTEEVWPDSAVRLLRRAAAETSATLTRVYSYQAAASEARTDQLTGLPNRRAFDEYCNLIATRRRATDRVAILAVDVDHFKRVNDVYGHQSGDLVLRAIASAINASTRDDDVPARYGGEEFMVVLRNPAAGVAMEIGERIRRSVSELDLRPFGIDDGVTVSVGVAYGTHAGEPIDDIVERADRALYTAKRTGRDRVIETLGAVDD